VLLIAHFRSNNQLAVTHPKPGKIACRQLEVTMRTRELQESWLLWLDASDMLQRSLHELTVAITLRDTDRVNRLESETEQMQIRLRELHEDILALTYSTAKSLGTEATLSGISSVLDKVESQSLKGLANRATVAGRTVDYLLKKNYALFQCRFAVVVDEDRSPLAKAA